MRTEFERVQPEEVNISNQTIWNLLNRLEHEQTQMHGLMIMKDGKICAEGWWAPFAPGIFHGNQSLTKTYAATAIGIAVTEGILFLDDKVSDIFSEEMPDGAEGAVYELKISDVLSMSCGMETLPGATEHWITDFLATEIKHQPGTEFFYNSVGSNLLAAVINKVSGMGLVEFLEKKLFCKIGIEKGSFICYNLPDGTAAGGGGSYSTTENNLRLMKLYADGGVCNGERILSEEYVHLATTRRVRTDHRAGYRPEIRNANCGYGFQIWMCEEPNTYRADGAYGQFSIVNTDLNLIVSIHETADGESGPEKTLQAVMDFIREIKKGNSQKETVSDEALSNRLNRLCLPHPVRGKENHGLESIFNRKYMKQKGIFDLECNVLPLIIGSTPTEGVKEFVLSHDGTDILMEVEQNDVRQKLSIPLDGSRRFNKIFFNQAPGNQVYYSAVWEAENVLCITGVWVQTCNTIVSRFEFIDSFCKITTTMPKGGLDDKAKEAVFCTK